MKQYDIEIISELMIESITEFFDYYDLPYTDGPRTICFPCPVHDGSREFGSSILKQDVGNWRCYTAQCHEQYGTSNGASIIQFAQAVLSAQENREYSFFEALQWCAKFVGQEAVDESTINTDHIEFIKLCKYINRKKKEAVTFTPRELVRKFLAIPSAYYMKATPTRPPYSAEILERFDIGYCHNEKKLFYDRVVTPFYDDSGCYMVGCSGRSRHEKCDKCGLHHDPNVRCPVTKDEKMKCYKWKHSSQMNVEDYCYNYWNAKEHIAQTGTVIVVEGPGDVWRLEEAGIHNGIALLKAALSPGQRMVLEASGAINLVIATDMDDAGNKGATSITKQCDHLFNTIRLKYDANDIGAMLPEQVKEQFLPTLEKL